MNRKIWKVELEKEKRSRRVRSWFHLLGAPRRLFWRPGRPKVDVGYYHERILFHRLSLKPFSVAAYSLHNDEIDTI